VVTSLTTSDAEIARDPRPPCGWRRGGPVCFVAPPRRCAAASPASSLRASGATALATNIIVIADRGTKQAGLQLSPKKTGFLIQGEDRVGAVADIVGKLAAANVNVTAMDAVCAGEERYGAILWVKAPDVRKAAKALGAS